MTVADKLMRKITTNPVDVKSCRSMFKYAKMALLNNISKVSLISGCLRFGPVTRFVAQPTGHLCEFVGVPHSRTAIVSVFLISRYLKIEIVVKRQVRSGYQ